MGRYGEVAVARSRLLIVEEDRRLKRGQGGQRIWEEHMCIDNSTR